MLVGGIMGLIKVIGPNMSWLSYRHLFNADSIYRISITYITYYSVIMAILEIISAILLLMRIRIGFMFALITLLLNAVVCLFAIIMGDLYALFSLIIRLLGIYVLLIAKKLFAD
ncbi:hypothetical protein HZI73_18210 [Vallitalea pronyensis]|uniref:Uncharacterized protein n=1 Tax=Vallitalea pronyensis TaxID=1348613 RepID=A0A8J8MMR3_9FIRM|nr:hypothetical protein [Vallitalea pronyensis]QUI24108.1 hypothetical protein HZI73_18210 [Vallitalea pronyensis]